jgi:hypothetical protein
MPGAPAQMACLRQQLAREDFDMLLREVGGQGKRKRNSMAATGADDGVLDVLEIATLRHGLDRDASIDVTA